ncbi:MAG: sulfotransferase [Pseudomonadota bacterium]
MDRHVVLTLGRSGSNTLRDMLNQSPEVLNFGEVLGEWNTIRKIQRKAVFLPRSDEAFLDWVLYSGSFLRAVNTIRSVRKSASGERGAVKRVSGLKTFGIKDFSLNFMRYGLSGYFDARPDIRVIGLIRDDVVERMVSNAMLGATGVIESRGGEDGEPRRLSLDPARVGELLSDIETENADLHAMLDRLPQERKHVIHYDDLFSNSRQRIMTETFGFLGVRPVQTQERMHKIIRRPVNEVIENFDDCLDAVRGTHHETLLREASGG